MLGMRRRHFCLPSCSFTQGQVKLTNRRVGKRKVSSRKRKKVEYRRTEGDHRNTQTSFRLQDFKMWKYTVLLLLALLPTVNSNETPTPRMCAVCLRKDCANAVRRIYPAFGDKAVWPNANSRTEIQNCSMMNLKPDAPCKMANGSLVQLADNPLQFDGIDAYGVRHVLDSQISSCADLNLPPSYTPSPVFQAAIHDTSTPAAPNNSVADNKGIAIAIAIASVIAIAIASVIGIAIFIGVLIRKRNSRGQGQDRNHRHRNCRNWNLNPCPNGKAAETGLLNGKAANGNLNKVR